MKAIKDRLRNLRKNVEAIKDDVEDRLYKTHLLQESDSKELDYERLDRIEAYYVELLDTLEDMSSMLTSSLGSKNK